MPNFRLTDQRQYPRVRISASAILVVPDKNPANKKPGHEIAVVENLSAGGALLLSNDPLNEEQQFEVVLAVGDAQPLRIPAEVIRCTSADDRWRVAVRFLHETPATEDQIQEMVLQELERIRANPVILVVCGLREKFRHFESSYLSMGRRVVFSDDPQEALWLLQDPGTHIDTVFLELSLVSELIHPILAFLESEFPQIRRIVVINNRSDIKGTEFRAHALVQEPLDFGFLENLLGLRARRFQNELLIEGILKDLHP